MRREEIPRMLKIWETQEINQPKICIKIDRICHERSLLRRNFNLRYLIFQP
jgi:hypothetical protein